MARRKRIKDVDWQRYADIINDFVDVDAGKQKIVWLRYINQPLPYGEDSGEEYVPVVLEGLIQYNYIRTWPSLKETVGGDLDGINIAIYFTQKQLGDQGYLNKDGYWDFNWSRDRFIINGKVYEPGGDTQVAQAKDKPLLFFLVIKRSNPEESNSLISYLDKVDI